MKDELTMEENEHIMNCGSCQSDLDDIGFNVEIETMFNWDKATFNVVQEFATNMLYGDGNIDTPFILNGYEHTDKIRELKQVLTQEIEWCSSDEAKQIDKTQDFKDGFLEGLKQAMLFIEKFEDTEKAGGSR